MSDVMHLQSSSVAETAAIGEAIGQAAPAGAVVALIGELGAGKTQLVRGLAAGLGLDAGRVSSPTFVLMHEYESDAARLALVHIDAYRVQSLGDLESLGWGSDPDLRRDALVAIEWADRLGERALGEDVLTVSIAHGDAGARDLTLMPTGRWVDAALSGPLQRFMPTGPTTPCPICARPVRAGDAMYPFCSGRCRTIDLGKWLGGEYKISRPVEQRDLEEGLD